jgi:UDP-2-acetamido-3-amino-2,3-dideoxy-glucuronate N-acetyltransferase
MPGTVAAHGGQYLNKAVADVTVTTMDFSGGTKAHIFVSWLHPYKEQKLVVIGDRKMAMFDDVAVQDKLVLYDNYVVWQDRVAVPNKTAAKPVELEMDEPLKLECQHFIECLATGRKPRTSGEKGLKVLRVLDACQKSLDTQSAVISLSSAGREYFLHATSILEEPSSVGKGTKIWHFCHVMPNVTIGKSCTLGQNVFIGKGVAIGDNVKLENNVSVFEGVTIEDDVFCGPSCVFTNVSRPRSYISQKSKFSQTRVKKGATIGANSTIVCGHDVGRYSFVGAGAVVTKEVPDYAMVYGNPARIQGWVCECGATLKTGTGSKVKCSSCGIEYVRTEVGGEERVERVA